MIVAGNLVLPPEQRPPLWVNVPSLPPHPLVGRDELLADLVHRLTTGHSPALSTDGQGGAGKTALAIAAAHHPAVLAHFTGGVLWGSLGQQPDAALILNQWADALHVPVADLPTLEQRRAKLTATLAGKRVLVVLDDAWDEETPRQLKLSGPHVVHLLTTRSAGIARRFAGAAQQVHVPELDSDPAFILLAELAPEACAADPAAARQLAAAVGGLPLALVVLGGYLATGSGQYFAHERTETLKRAGDPATRLALACARLGTEDRGDLTLEQVITLSLTDLPKNERRAFYALGAFAAKPARFDQAAALAVAGPISDIRFARSIASRAGRLSATWYICTANASAEVLSALINRNLLEIDSEERMAVHQVVSQVARHHTPEAAKAAFAAYYLALVRQNQEDWQHIGAEYTQIRHALEQLDSDDAHILSWVSALRLYWVRRGLGSEQLRWAQQALKVAQQTGDFKTQAALLSNIGGVYSALGDKQAALRCYEQALPLHQQVGDKSGEATTLNNIGVVYAALGDQPAALGYYEQALPQHKQVGDKSGEAQTLNNIGSVYSALGDNQAALGYYEQALPLQQQVGDKAGEATTLNNIGSVYWSTGDQQAALRYYEQSLPLRRQVGDKAGEATTLSNIGMVHADLGDQPAARRCLEQALLLFRQVGDKSSEANTLTNIGTVYSNLDDKQVALRYYEQALPLRRQVGDKWGEARTLGNIGLVFSALGDKQAALGYYEQALPLARQVGDKAGEATTLNNIGSVYWSTGDQQAALRYYEQALPLRRQVGDKSGEATTLHNIGTVYDKLGDQQAALRYYEQALPLRRQVGDKSGEAVTLIGIGKVYSNLGDQQAALGYFEQALPLQQQVGDKSGEAATLNNIGSVYWSTGDQQAALRYYEQALPLRRQVGDKSGEATTLHNIGTVYDALGDKQAALRYYEQALPLRRQVGDRFGESVTRFNIAMAAAALGDLDRAVAELEQVVAIDEAVGHPDLANDRAALEQMRARRASQFHPS